MRKRRKTVLEDALFMHEKDTLHLRLERVLAGKQEWDAVGCSSDDLRRHIESVFTGDMAWQNHGIVWHMDFIVPRAAFKPSQADRAFHWTNLQPTLGQFGRAIYRAPPQFGWQQTGDTKSDEPTPDCTLRASSASETHSSGKSSV